MEIYILLFLVLLVFVFLENRNTGVPAIYKFSIVIAAIIISGFRYEVGNDYDNYVDMFYKPDNYFAIEPGFKALIGFINNMGGNPQMLFLVCTLAAIIPLAIIIQKFVPTYFMTAFATYVFTYIYFEGMNTIRQAISMSLVLVAVCMYVNYKKLYIYISLVTLAMLFHISALFVGGICLLLYRFSGSKLRINFFFVLLLFSFVAGYFIKDYMGIISDIVGGMAYDRYLDRVEQRGVNGGLFHIVLNIYAIALMLYTRKKEGMYSLFEKTSIKLFVLSIVTYNFFFNFYIGLRLYWYFYLFSIFVVPLIIRDCKRGYRFLLFLAIMMVFIVYTIVSLDTPSYNTYSINFSLDKPM